MPLVPKQNALLLLAKRRQLSRVDGFFCLHEVAGGIYECDYVSPWSKSAQHVDAQIMVVGQDWASKESLENPRDDRAMRDRIELGYDTRIPTNINLHRLLRDHLGTCFSETYATNAFPFIKVGGMQGRISTRSLVQSVKDFLLPQIEVVRPKIVICLGLSTFNALRITCGEDRLRRLEEALRMPFNLNGPKIVAVAHTGARGINNRGLDRVEGDWALIAKLLIQANRS